MLLLPNVMTKPQLQKNCMTQWPTFLFSFFLSLHALTSHYWKSFSSSSYSFDFFLFSLCINNQLDAAQIHCSRHRYSPPPLLYLCLVEKQSSSTAWYFHFNCGWQSPELCSEEGLLLVGCCWTSASSGCQHRKGHRLSCCSWPGRWTLPQLLLVQAW